MSTIFDPFVPDPDETSRHSIDVHAPAGLVQEVSRDFDMQSIAAVRAIFSLRGKILRANNDAPAGGVGLVPYTQSLGWGVLLDVPGRAYIAGASCQPWEADVVFESIPPERFATYDEPDRVKIAWSLETEPIESSLTRFSTETRVVATDDEARTKLRRYWRVFGIGIVTIRWLLLPAVRRAAERRYRDSRQQ